MKSFPLICALVGSSLLLPQAYAQSLGEVARVHKASKKTTRIVTNDNLPEAKGPANGAASMPVTKAAEKDSMPPESEKLAASEAKPQQAKELEEEIKFFDNQLATLTPRIEEETNEATRGALERMAESYKQRRAQVQQQLDELKSVDPKSKVQAN